MSDGLLHRRHRLSVLVCGTVAADVGQGGVSWSVLQYVLGLRRLGHDVCVVEPIAGSKIEPVGAPLAGSTAAAYFRKVVEEFGIADKVALLLAKSHETVGASFAELRQFCKRADLLININGMLTDPALIESIPVRVYLDLDPAFVQLWQVEQGIDMRLDGHTHFASVGLNIGTPQCSVPTCGVEWIKTLQPVVLEEWPFCEHEPMDALTTVGNWRGYGSIHVNGIQYGQKAHSLRPLIELPRKTRENFVLAMRIDPAETKDIDALKTHGWKLVSPDEVAGSPTLYRNFIQNSKGEFGIAKSGYVNSRCGWFSDRSAAYLASGRPVIAQETGFSGHLPTGKGLMAFANTDDVAAAVDSLRKEYSLHQSAARQIAVEYFDSDKVLARLLNRLGVTP
jgi:hypothetical protein